MANTTLPHNDTTPDTLRSALEALDLFIALAKEKASIGQIHDAVFSDVIQHLEQTRAALNSAQKSR